MASAVKIRYVYETSFFDGRNDCWTSQPDNPPEEVDSAVNHPIVRKIQQAVIRARKAVTSSMNSNPNIDMTGHSEPDRSSLQLQRSNISSLQTSICSLDESAQDLDGRLILNRSRSLQQTHHLFHSVDSHHNYHHHHRGFSLHLSPKQRTKVSEAVLSPISDKSENETSQMLTTTTVPIPSSVAVPFEFHAAARRRPQSLFSNIISGRPSGSAGGFNGSDSGISISANSLVTNDSHEALQPLNKPPLHLSLDNSQEFLSSSSSEPPEENLPFLMPKLRRGTNNNSGIFKPQTSAPIRQLSLTLSFPPLQSLPFVAPAVGFKDLVDDAIPLEIQSWYHGSITRRDAEKRLKPAPAGSFLVRDSMASHADYFLAARGENGFLHVRVCCNTGLDDPNKDFTLVTLPERRFESVAAVVNHCANIGVYSRHLPPAILKYPLNEESV